jgi:dihydroorotate dehydrogenase (NAD+) catalytic subunit
MESFVDLSRLGGMIPKTVTPQPRQGNHPWRTIETTGGMLNSIGLDNDGIQAFCEHHLPYLATLGCPVIVSVAAPTADEYASMAEQLSTLPEVDAVELNISCPNVSGGVDFGTDPAMCEQVVAGVRDAVGDLPIIAKLTPNVTRITEIADAARCGGADAVSATNTLLGMAVDWRRQKPSLGNVLGGLSGPAIKPVALRCVHQIRQAVDIPILGVGGIATIDDVMDFLVAGATAVQIGTANFYDPTVSMRILQELPAAVAELGAESVAAMVGSLQLEKKN